MPFGHTSPAPFGGTLPKGEGLGVVVLNNHLPQRGLWGAKRARVGVPFGIYLRTNRTPSVPGPQ